jgi:hypothetical protein
MAVCLGAGYLAAAAAVAFLAQTAASDGVAYTLGLTVFWASHLAADALVPGPAIWLGRRASYTWQLIGAAVILLQGLVVFALGAAIGPGWAGPVLLFWTVPVALVLVVALGRAVRPPGDG